MPIISFRGIVSVVGQVVNLLSAWFAIWKQGGRETGELVRAETGITSQAESGHSGAGFHTVN